VLFNITVKQGLSNDSLVIWPIPVQSGYPDNMEKCYDGLCYVMRTRHLTADLTVQKNVINDLGQLIHMRG
jgi:hypothetical protein